MFDEARLIHLISAYFDQQLPPDEKGELEAMLLGSSRARGIFLEHADWHGLSREWALRDVSLEAAPAPPTQGKKGRRRYILWAAIGLASCLLLSWTIFRQRNSPRIKEATEAATTLSSHEDVAMLGQMAGVVWDDGMPRLAVGSPVSKGWIHIREGTLRLDFYSGATVILDAPASLELISTDLIRLEKGRLTANVPPPADGFSILSGDLRVVGRGAEFGMNVVKPGDCEVHVFKGEVDLQGDVPAGANRELREGYAISIHDGQATHLLADRKAFTDLTSLHHIDLVETEARWRNWKESSLKFRTTPDLLAYFDFEDMEPGVPILPNRAAKSLPDSFGTVVGCEQLSGRWKEKGALGFTKTSDRIRFRLAGSTSSLTLMAWVRVDSLILEHSSLLSMAPDEIGELHWKIGKSGRLLVGLRASPALRFDSWERLESPIVVTERDLGRWMHVATVIDGQSRIMRHYVNGDEVAAGHIRRLIPVRLGMANLGNFDSANPQRPKYSTGRSFNGRIDEFAMIARSLTKEEIREAAR